MRKEKFQLYMATHPSVARTHHTVDTMRYITEIIPPTEYPKLLDIGCADGSEAKALFDLGYDVTGITQGSLNVEYARENYPEVNIMEMDMHDLGFLDDSFDAICCIHTFEHALAPFILLAEMYAVLRQKGRIWVSTPENAEVGTARYMKDVSVISHHHPNILTPSMYEQYFRVFYSILPLPPDITGICYLLEPKEIEALHSDIQTALKERKNIKEVECEGLGYRIKSHTSES